MLTLTPEECRVLGVLVEKAQTTPQQYPLTLNSLTTGCNQKNNRHPVTAWDEERVYDAVDALRAKGLVREAILSGSRVAKFRHVAREVLNINTHELVVLAELMLRGPETAGELRANASRMHPIESLEALQGILSGLISRPEPLIRELSGGRARRYAQLLCPTAHKLDEAEAEDAEGEPSARATGRQTDSGAANALAARVEKLEGDLGRLREAVKKLSAALGGVEDLNL